MLVAPICLLLLWQAHRISTLKPLLQEVLKWAAPFTPFVFGWMFAQLWHQYHPVDVTPLSTVVWCGLLFMGARLVGINHRQLSVIAGIAAFAYGVIALGEVFWAGRDRAWGGVYENRFGQYAIWLSALSVIHFFLDESLSKVSRAFLLWAALFGLIATWLSGSRGALLALPVLIVLLVLKSLNWRNGLFVVLALALALGVGCYLYSSIYDRFLVMYQEVFQYFNEPVFTATSIGVRLELARVALVTWGEHPLLGAGYVSLRQLYESHPNLGVPAPGVLIIPGFHSDWFQVMGIGGGLLLSSLLVTTFWLFCKARHDPYRLLFLGFSMVFGLSELFMTHNLGLGLLMSCWALYSAAERNRTSPYEAY
ncbi:O-antigen ligase family protein [Rhodoferax sp.]|uniref:O-antigen ligase family protein n=1 Tax=Rhodoferax sp. TaxID=50421 RepID=UPI002ACDA33C|nr:O-antigen ligase family protein [Rhodoferax sp.]MDZ7921050.1 O-antigen ligase family protein [Rhodoferax sp.]